MEVLYISCIFILCILLTIGYFFAYKNYNEKNKIVSDFYGEKNMNKLKECIESDGLYLNYTLDKTSNSDFEKHIKTKENPICIKDSQITFLNIIDYIKNNQNILKDIKNTHGENNWKPEVI